MGLMINIPNRFRKISRRDFIKLAALSGAGISLLPYLSSCEPQCPPGMVCTPTPTPDFNSPSELNHDYFYDIAMKCRPFYCFSNEDTNGGSGGGPEYYAPCSWQWLYNRSVFKDGHGSSTPLNPNNFHIVTDSSNVNGINGAPPNRDAIVELQNIDTNKIGEPWPDVSNGDGFYCHVTYLGTAPVADSDIHGTNVFNLEYWTLFAYNRFIGTDQLPRPVCQALGIGADCGNHPADLIVIQMVYSEKCQAVTRLSFVQHGFGLDIFDVPEYNPEGDPDDSLPGVDANGNDIRIPRRYVKFDKEYRKGCDCPYFTSAENYGYFTSSNGAHGGYTHPMIFLENGSHEPWPNDYRPDDTNGGLTGAQNHSGQCYSFMPKNITLLDDYHPNLNAPVDPKNNPADITPFMYFAGHLGGVPDGPNAIQCHKFWYGNTPGIPEDTKADKGPYYTHDDPLRVTWPPSPMLMAQGSIENNFNGGNLAVDNGNFYWAHYLGMLGQSGTAIMQGKRANGTGALQTTGTLIDNIGIGGKGARLMAVDNGIVYYYNEEGLLFSASFPNGVMQRTLIPIQGYGNFDLLAVDNNKFYMAVRLSESNANRSLFLGELQNGTLVQETTLVPNTFVSQVLAVDNGNIYTVQENSKDDWRVYLTEIPNGGNLNNLCYIQADFNATQLAVDNNIVFWKNSNDSDVNSQNILWQAGIRRICF
jgi:hypothetical protein